jgi:hypothetical protein
VIYQQQAVAAIASAAAVAASAGTIRTATAINFGWPPSRRAAAYCLSMISAQTPLAFVARENRYPLFRITL